MGRNSGWKMKQCPLCKGKLSKQECICFQVAVKAKAQLASIERIEEGEEEFPIPERVGNLRAISFNFLLTFPKQWMWF